MTPLPDDDSKLVNFLQQHRAQVPPAASELEDQILAAVEAASKPVPTRAGEGGRFPLWGTGPQSRRCRPWIVSSAIAAGVIAAVVGYRQLMPTQPSATELANLESFMENSWYSTVTDSPDSDLLSSNDS